GSEEESTPAIATASIGLDLPSTPGLRCADYTLAPPDRGTGGAGPGEHGFVQAASRHAHRQEGEPGLDGSHATGQTDPVDRRSTERRCIDSQLIQTNLRIRTYELPADLVMRTGFLFDQEDVATRPGQQRGSRTAGGPPAHDDRIAGACIRHARSGRMQPTPNRKGKYRSTVTSPLSRPAASSNRRQSSWVKARAIETGPSCTTRG